MQTNAKAEMHKIAVEMAKYFNSNVSNKELIAWHIKANYMLYDSLFDGNKEDAGAEASCFLASFEYNLIPNLLDAKSDKERLSVLIEELPALCYRTSYASIKIALAEIGKLFLMSYSKLLYFDTDIEKFMRPLQCFMTISEMNADYEFLRDEEFEKQLKAA